MPLLHTNCLASANSLLLPSRALSSPICRPYRYIHRNDPQSFMQVTIGPWTERGFFYDFDMPQPLTEKDLPKIRKEMQRILRKNLPFIREEVSVEEARARIQVSAWQPL